MTATVETFAVPALNLGNLTKRLDKLARKANKYGNNPIGYSIGDSFLKKTTIYVDNKPRKIETKFVNVTVWGDAPKYGNHTFLARVELRSGENIVNNIAGIELDDRFRHMVSECDHCGHKRNRNDVYIFADETGNQIAVGRTCLRDFTGCDNPLEITGRAQFLADIKTAMDDELNDFAAGYGKTFYDLNRVMTFAAANIRTHGWVSNAMMQNDWEGNLISTSEMVMNDLTPNAYRKPIETTDADKALALETITHFRNMAPVKGNDYLNNLRVILGDQAIVSRHIGIAVSAIQVIQREKQKVAEKKTQIESDYIGTEKQRIRGTELTFIRETAMGFSNYGETFLYTFQDNSGNVLTWFTGKRDFNTGEKYIMDFTVKGHREYNGIKQTNITRATIK